MEVVGGDLNAYTTKDETFFYAGAPRGELVRAMELLADLVRHATFPERELEKERIVVADEINLYRDTPSDQIFDDWEDLYFAGTPLGHPILGTPESIRGITPELLRRYARRQYRPERGMVFFCMGLVSERRFLYLCEKYLSEPFDQEIVPGDDRDPAAPGRRAAPEPPRTPFRVTRPGETNQAHTLIGGKAFAVSDPRRTEAGMLLSILAGQSANSRLSILLREKRGWVYGVEGANVAISDAGWWQIYFGCDPGRSSRVLDAALAELRQTASRPLSPTFLAAWKKQLKGQLAMSSEAADAVFLNFGRQLLLKGAYDPLSRSIERIDAVTPESLHAVSQELFDPSNISILTLAGKTAG